jgi:glycogen operon protein
VEGPTDDPAVEALRSRQQRNFLTTLLLSQGVPMIAHGDELGRSQRGNNNVYCQDNELSWVDWDLDEEEQALLAFTQRIIALRNDHPVFRRRRFLVGRTAGEEVGDVAWFAPDGRNMKDADWGHEYAKAVLVFLNGDAILEPDQRGEPVVDDSFLIAFNASDEDIEFTIPGELYGDGWLVTLDTSDDEAGIVSMFDDATTLLPGLEFTVTARSMFVLRRPHEQG